MKQVKVIIPARYNSTRFVGKPLVDINGKPMIIRVVEIACETLGKENVFVATDDERPHEDHVRRMNKLTPVKREGGKAVLDGEYIFRILLIFECIIVYFL